MALAKELLLSLAELNAIGGTNLRVIPRVGGRGGGDR